MSAPIKKFPERPTVERIRPNRGAGNFYRAASDDSRAVGGIPLDNVEATVTAAVRTGYRIAQAQLDRSARLARRLREAGDEATGVGEDGQRSDVKALDATEQLIFKGLMSGLSWFEGVAAEGDNPLKRLATAEFRMLGSMLGLLPREPQGAGAAAGVGSRRRSEGAGPPTSGASEVRRHRPLPKIRHLSGGSKSKDKAARAAVQRPVRVREFELLDDVPGDYLVVFYHRDLQRSLKGTLRLTPTAAPVLSIATPASAPLGVYKGAVCDAGGLQIGRLDIVL